MAETFRDAINKQLGRLSMFLSWRMMENTGRAEYRRFFEKRTSDIAKVAKTVDEMIEKTDLPTLAAVREIWLGLYPPAGVRGCRSCGGTGWEIVESGIYTGAKPCRCRGRAQTASQ